MSSDIVSSVTLRSCPFYNFCNKMARNVYLQHLLYDGRLVVLVNNCSSSLKTLCSGCNYTSAMYFGQFC